MWCAYEAATDDERPAPDRLAHADLKPEHVLHDPTSGQITGVLDWGDACLSHATFDLVIVGLFFDASVRDEPFQHMCAAELRAHLQVALRQED